MARDSNRQRQFTRRALLLGGGQFALLAALAGRLYYLQVVESGRYLTLAEDNRINLQLIAPTRGRILDRHGRPLAVNRQEFRLVPTAEQAGDIGGTSMRWRLRSRSAMPIASACCATSSASAASCRSPCAMISAGRTSPASRSIPRPAGRRCRGGVQSREYPYGDQLSHVLGYVGPVSETDAAAGNALLQLPGSCIGKVGIEKSHEIPLRGIGGASQVEVNAVGRVIREASVTMASPAPTLTLALDLELQQLAVQRLEASGAAVAGHRDRRGAGDGIDAGLRSGGVQPRADGRRMEGADLRSEGAAGQQGDRRAVRPGLHLQAGGGAGGAGARGHHPGNPGVLSRRLPRRHLGVPLLEAPRPRLAGAARSHHPVLRLLLLRGGAARRRRQDRRHGQAAGLGRPLGIDLPHERGGFLPTAAWSGKGQGVVDWRNGDHRHRPGLCAGDAATGDAGGAHRQRPGGAGSPAGP
ncbi:MAG: hypothetical protein U1E38_10415 [Rhodospirillales bacterium]